MWKNLDRFTAADASLEFDGTGVASPEELIVSTLATLLRAGYSDGVLASDELERAVAVAAHEFQVGDAKVRSLVEVADFLARDSAKLSSLLEAIKQRFSEPQKVEIVKAVWRVLVSDGKTSIDEARFAAEIRTLLGLSLEQGFFAAQSRHRE